MIFPYMGAYRWSTIRIPSLPTETPTLAMPAPVSAYWPSAIGTVFISILLSSWARGACAWTVHPISPKT